MKHSQLALHFGKVGEGVIKGQIILFSVLFNFQFHYLNLFVKYTFIIITNFKFSFIFGIHNSNSITKWQKFLFIPERGVHVFSQRVGAFISEYNYGTCFTRNFSLGFHYVLQVILNCLSLKYHFLSLNLIIV